jgi:hypothetical protein
MTLFKFVAPKSRQNTSLCIYLVTQIYIMMQCRGIMLLQRASRVCLHLTRSQCSSKNANCCDGATPLEPLVPPAPGTVKEHFHHVLIKLNKPANAANKGGEPGHLWWPSNVER